MTFKESLEKWNKGLTENMQSQLKLIRRLIVPIMLLTVAACGKAPSTTELDSDIKTIEMELEEARIDAAAAGSNRLASALAEQRVQILRDTNAMLKQKRKAFLRGIRLNYTVDGKEFKRPNDWEARIKALDDEIIKAKGSVIEAKSSAGGMGGLFGLVAAAGGSMASLNVALLEHKRLLLKHEIPTYALLVKDDEAPMQEKPTVNSPSRPVSSPPKSVKAEPVAKKRPASLELVSFKRQHLPVDTDDNRYSAAVNLVLKIKNKTDKTIKAWSVHLVARNAFDKKILEVNLESNTSDIMPGQTEDASFSWEDNKFIDDEPYDKIMATSDDNLKLEFSDDKVVTK